MSASWAARGIPAASSSSRIAAATPYRAPGVTQARTSWELTTMPNPKLCTASAAARKITTTPRAGWSRAVRSEEHTSELQSRLHLVCRLLLEKKKKNAQPRNHCAVIRPTSGRGGRPADDLGAQPGQLRCSTLDATTYHLGRARTDRRIMCVAE